MGFVEDKKTAVLFLIVPTVMLIVGYFIFPFPASDVALALVQIPMFLGLILLGVGFFIKKQGLNNVFKILGWGVFAFYWATQPATMYLSEGGDVFNSVVCIIGVYVLFYIAYHEWLSLVRKEDVSCLNWIAGASFIAGIIYFTVERSFIAEWLIDIVAHHSAWALDTIIGNAHVIPGTVNIWHNGMYAVTIIFACTAIQSMVIFVGMIGVVPRVDVKRKAICLTITLVPIYILNVLRNALVVFLVGNNITDFNMAHNVISKIGALVALIVLLLIVIRIIPEIFDEIICLTNLYKRNGPLEKAVGKVFGSKKKK